MFDKWENETIKLVKLKRAGFTMEEIENMDPFEKHDIILLNDVMNATERMKNG